MNLYQKGRRNEYRTMRLLEQAGYLCVRAAGSHSPFDIVGITASDIILVQVKTNEQPGAAEMEKLQNVRIPASVRKLVHCWKDGRRFPTITEVP